MKENAYFDNAATSWPKPEPVYRFMDRFFRTHGVNPGRSGHTLAVEAEQMIVATRSMLAEFFSFTGDSNRVIFTQNGTDALNMAIRGLLAAGDHMIISRLEHNAVLRTASHLERDAGIQVTRVAPDPDGYIDPQHIEAAIRPATRLIVLNHASNVIGTVQPVEEVAGLARQRGIPMVLDAAQTAGTVPIDMQALGLSILTFPGHKGLFGPMGIGGMILNEDTDLPAQRFGGTGVDSLSIFQPEVYPHRLEAGTLALPAIAGLHAAQRWFRELGEQCRQDAGLPTGASHGLACRYAIEHIHATELAYLRRIEQTLRQLSGVRILGAARDSARVATLSFTVGHMPTERVADMLDADHHICARAGLQCAPLVHVDAGTVDIGGTIRLSPGYFTDEDDMAQLLDALRTVLA